MVVAALNFSRHFLAFRSLSFKPYRDGLRGQGGAHRCSACSVVLVSALLCARRHATRTTMEAFRHSVFNVVSIATTTGFVTEDYEKWPAFLPVWLLFLSCITCSTGSTGGGIKMFRTLLLVRQARRELKLLVHPSAVIPIRIGGNAIPERVVHSVLAFIFLYFGTILVLTFALAGHGPRPGVVVLGGGGLDATTWGPGLGAVGPSTNFSAPERRADLDLHAGNAHRPPGNLQRAGAVHRATSGGSKKRCRVRNHSERQR